MLGNELNEIKVELIDRFGLLPEAATNLLTVNSLKLKAAIIGVKKIESNEKGGYFEFKQDAAINPQFLVSLLQTQPQHFRMEGPTKLKIVSEQPDRKKRIKFIEDLLNQFRENMI